MASSAMRFPDEILMNVCSYLDLPSEYGSTHGWSRGDVRPTLCALALTCKRMSGIVREFICQDVRLATGHVSSMDLVYTTDRLRKFIRTCNEWPDTIDRIKSLQMQSDFSATPDWGVSKDDKVPDGVLQAVNRSTSLEHLSILLPGTQCLQWLPSLLPSLPDGKLYNNLQSLHLDCGKAPIQPMYFLCLCLLPLLKQIEISSPIRHSRTSRSLLPNCTRVLSSLMRERTSSVEKIISTDVSASSSELYLLFQQLPKLETLQSSLPGMGLAFDDHETAHHRSRRNRSDPPGNRQFSPFEQQRLLDPIAETLRSLSMTNPRVLVHGHDGSLLDLSHFKKLEHLELSIHFLCPASIQDARKLWQEDQKPCKPYQTLSKLLPRSLRTLEIHYDSDQGIFYDAGDLYTAYYIEEPVTAFPLNINKATILPLVYNNLYTERISSMNGENGVRSRLDWLFELGMAKHTTLPHLTEVTVRETYARDWTWRDLDLTIVHPDVFSNQPVKMSVILRQPKEWNALVDAKGKLVGWNFGR